MQRNTHFFLRAFVFRISTRFATGPLLSTSDRSIITPTDFEWCNGIDLPASDRLLMTAKYHVHRAAAELRMRDLRPVFVTYFSTALNALGKSSCRR